MFKAGINIPWKMVVFRPLHYPDSSLLAKEPGGNFHHVGNLSGNPCLNWKCEMVGGGKGWGDDLCVWMEVPAECQVCI